MGAIQRGSERLRSWFPGGLHTLTETLDRVGIGVAASPWSLLLLAKRVPFGRNKSATHWFHPAYLTRLRVLRRQEQFVDDSLGALDRHSFALL